MLNPHYIYIYKLYRLFVKQVLCVESLDLEVWDRIWKNYFRILYFLYRIMFDCSIEYSVMRW